MLIYICPVGTGVKVKRSGISERPNILAFWTPDNGSHWPPLCVSFSNVSTSCDRYASLRLHFCVCRSVSTILLDRDMSEQTKLLTI